MAEKTDGKKSDSAPKKARGKAKAKVKGKASKESKNKWQTWTYSESCFLPAMPNPWVSTYMFDLYIVFPASKFLNLIHTWNVRIV